MLDVITIGNATRDVILQSPAFKVYKDRHFATGYAEAFAFGSKVDIDRIYFGVGGGGINSATTFARQGLKTAYLGKVGEDCPGREVREHLKKENIIDDFLTVSDEVTTSYSTILSTHSGERTVLVYRGEAQALTRTDIDYEKLVCSWIYITSVAGHIKILEKILKHAYKNRIKVALNPGVDELNQPEFIKLLPFVDVLLFNREEAEKLLPKHKRKNNSIFQGFNGITKAITVVTDGTRGAVCGDGRKLYYIEASKTEVVDRLGAGDAFGSGFVSGLIQTDGNIVHALQLGVSNAGSVCKLYGATPGILHKNSTIQKSPVTEHTLK